MTPLICVHNGTPSQKPFYPLSLQRNTCCLLSSLPIMRPHLITPSNPFGNDYSHLCPLWNPVMRMKHILHHPICCLISSLGSSHLLPSLICCLLSSVDSSHLYPLWNSHKPPFENQTLPPLLPQHFALLKLLQPPSSSSSSSWFYTFLGWREPPLVVCFVWYYYYHIITIVTNYSNPTSFQRNIFMRNESDRSALLSVWCRLSVRFRLSVRYRQASSLIYRDNMRFCTFYDQPCGVGAC